MDEGRKALSMWSLGFGDRNEVMLGNGVPRPERRALKSDWKTLKMPCSCTEIGLDIPLTDEEFELLSLGHVPEVMEDHWFSYFDGESLNMYRSWTGYCIYRVRIQKLRDGYAIVGATVNRDASQYSETSDDRDCIMVEILVGEALGRDVSELWEKFFSIEKEPDAHRHAVDETPNIIGFWSAGDAFGEFSNWYPAGFEFLGTQFATSEHWMMWQKARVMRDYDAADKIIEAPTPGDAKALGRQVTPFDGPLWDAISEELVYYGVREKFLQNPRLRNLLFSTGSAVLAEAAPGDKTWGIGITVDHPDFRNIAAWKGSNLQGRVCMRVRSDLREASLADIPLGELANRSWENAAQLLRTPIGGMSLLELSRVPAARPAVLCYARIAQRHLMDPKIYNAEAFLRSVGGSTVAGIDNMMRANMGEGLTIIGWNELVCQLAFLHAIGRI